MAEDSLYMDRACQVFIVIGAIVLFMMLVGEHWRQPSLQGLPRASSTCGAMRTTATEESDTAAASAKRVGSPTATDHGRSSSQPLAEQEHSYAAIGAPWLNDNYKGCQGVEMKQDEEELKKEFTWDADATVDEKFDDIAISEKKVLASANIRSLGVNTGYEAPTYSRRHGLQSNPWLRLMNKDSDNKRQFSKSCPWFGSTDSFHSARRELAMCDCLTDGCEEECKK